VAQTPEQFFGCGLEVDHPAAFTQVLAVGSPQYRTASRGNHLVRRLGQRIDNLGLDIAEARFPLTLKKLPYGATNTDFDLVVRVYKGQLQPSGELTSDGGFTRAWKANQRNRNNTPC